MSHPGNGRRLLRMEQTCGTKNSDWMAALREIDREQRAALALVKVAQALAGSEPPAAAPVAVREETLRPVEPLPAPRRPSRPVWGPNNRPSVHDVLTWDQVLQLEWIVETPVVEAPPTAPAEDRSPRPKDWVAPYGNGDFLFPSYALGIDRAADDEKE